MLLSKLTFARTRGTISTCLRLYLCSGLINIVRLRRKSHRLKSSLVCTSTKIQLFKDLIGSVHTYPLLKLVDEKTKLPRKLEDPLPLCACTIKASIGLPCFHTIWERQRNPGVILLSDIDPHCTTTAAWREFQRHKYSDRSYWNLWLFGERGGQRELKLKN